MEFQYLVGQVTFEDANQNHRDVSLKSLLGKVFVNQIRLVSGENVRKSVYNSLCLRILSDNTDKPLFNSDLAEFTLNQVFDIQSFDEVSIKELYQFYAENVNFQSSEIILSEVKNNTPIIQTQVNIPFVNYLGHYKHGQVTFAEAWKSQTTQKIGELLGKIDNPQYISSREISWRTHGKLQAYLTLYSYEADQNYDVIEDISLVDLSFDRHLELSEIEEIYEAYAKYATPQSS
jgi:hypothetical protein